MIQIFKETLELGVRTVLSLPTDKILSAENQNEELVMWYISDSDLTSQENSYVFRVVRTGEIIDFDIEDYTFLNTILFDNGESVFHVFYKEV